MKKQKPKETKYTFAPMPHGKLNKTQVTVVAYELRNIEEKYGAAKPANIVKEARSQKSALHPYFTWDNEIAGHEFRLLEAQTLSRSVRLVQVGVPLSEQPVTRAFIHVQAHEEEESFTGHGYISLQRVLADDYYLHQMLTEALASLKTFQQKYEDLIFMTGSDTIIEELQTRLAEKRQAKGKKRPSRRGSKLAQSGV